jgi:hypothetical protein
MSIDFTSSFKLPIFYNPQKKELKKHIVKDLELVETIENNGETKPIYDYLFSYKNDNFSLQTKQQLAEYYTTDTVFLKDTQTLLKSYSQINSKTLNDPLPSVNMVDMEKMWSEVKGDLSFKDKYFYLDWTSVEFLNKNELFLQMLSLYNLASPVISLMMPIIVVIIPFILLKMKGLPLTIQDYWAVLKHLIRNHAIAKLFTEFHQVDMNQKIYIVVSAAFYLFSIYQNITACYKFYKNMSQIQQYFALQRNYLLSTILKMNCFLEASDSLTSYSNFNKVLREKKAKLEEFLKKLEDLNEFFSRNEKQNCCTSLYLKLANIGKALKLFYEFYNDAEYEDAFRYSFGFRQYTSFLLDVHIHIAFKKMNFAKFISGEKKKKPKQKGFIKNNYYAALLFEENTVKNDVTFDKNMIITGPNASGKTTVLKSVLLNIIFSQQFGVGFYESAEIPLFENIHCYLNIPDTSGRDSLFQAEARRCKEIIDSVDENPDEKHFCVFDELYSGTNPEEAVASANAFMKYLLKNKNVFCMLTTHYVKLCKKLDKNKRIQNFHMKTELTENKVKFLYKVEKGISAVKGGFHVLSDMNYPKEILEGAKE